MGFHSIDMQQALHRNHDAGQQQRELQQRPIMEQAQLADQTARLAQAERHKTTQAARSKEADNRNQEHRKKRKTAEHGKNQAKLASSSEASQRPAHPPAKGRYIDVQL
ncbi:hypothetical protein [Paenibacillus senegalensis]|uniref:hypothetical protein n=1 Tax=Paenibacillus senegalensis TaxID=1465766 RepID=UPI0002893E08|nr:hypothetical protein [Paenibacillus senegalensis]